MTKKRWVCRAFWPPDNRDDQKTVGVSSVLASRNQGNGGCVERFGRQKTGMTKKTVGVSSVLAARQQGLPKNGGCLERFGRQKRGKAKKRWVCRAFWPPENRDDQKNGGCVERFGRLTTGMSKKTVGVSSVFGLQKPGVGQK